MPSPPWLRKQKATETALAAQKERVIWRGRRDRRTKQLVNKITASLTVLYPDIIKYMPYNTIRDKREAHRTNYIGQSVSEREARGASVVTEGPGGRGTHDELEVGGGVPSSRKPLLITTPSSVLLPELLS